MGHPLRIGGKRFFDFGIMNDEISLAAIKVVIRRRTVLRNLFPSKTSIDDDSNDRSNIFQRSIKWIFIEKMSAVFTGTFLCVSVWIQRNLLKVCKNDYLFIEWV
jgi:hypothetical protein